MSAGEQRLRRQHNSIRHSVPLLHRHFGKHKHCPNGPLLFRGFSVWPTKCKKGKRKAKLSRFAKCYPLNVEQKRKAQTCVCAIRSHGKFRQIPWIFYAPGVSFPRARSSASGFSFKPFTISPKSYSTRSVRKNFYGPVTRYIAFVCEWMDVNKPFGTMSQSVRKRLTYALRQTLPSFAFFFSSVLLFAHQMWRSSYRLQNDARDERSREREKKGYGRWHHHLIVSSSITGTDSTSLKSFFRHRVPLSPHKISIFNWQFPFRWAPVDGITFIGRII